MKRLGSLIVAGVALVGLSGLAAPSAAAATPDAQPPTVSLISPTSGASFSQNWEIFLYATASDADGTITKVEFYDGSTLLATDTQSLYYFSIRPGTASLGVHKLFAKAYDDQGLTATSAEVTVYVVPPVILRIPGVVQAGVEMGCMLLKPDYAPVSSTVYLLLGGDRKLLVPGAHVLVTGERMSGVVSYCQQGTPLRVDSVQPI